MPRDLGKAASKSKSILTLVALASALVALPAHADPRTFFVTFSGAAEEPPNGSAGTGTATVTFDLLAHTMVVDAIFAGLTGTTTASHIHCCTTIPGVSTAGVATTTPTFTGFPLGVTSGAYFHEFDMTLASSYNPAFVAANGGIAGAEARLFNGMLAGQSYLNIHSTFRPGGEIRGFLAVPEPATLALLGVGIAGLAATRRRKPR